MREPNLPTHSGPSPSPVRLHGYFRSSAAWRVRIALNLKGVEVASVAHHLRRNEQTAPDYLRLNPQGLVPTLEFEDGVVLTQSLAIIEWLDETYPSPPLLPSDPVARAHVRAFALAIASDTTPLQNLKILRRLRAAGLDEEAVRAWAAEANADGLTACETLAASGAGPFCFGDAPSLADLCLVPQLGGARRFGVDVGRFPLLLAREQACLALAAFRDAAPDQQSDAE